MTQLMMRIVYFCCLHFVEREISQILGGVKTFLLQSEMLFRFSDISALAVVVVVFVVAAVVVLAA